MPTTSPPPIQSSEMTGNSNPMENSIFADTQPMADEVSTATTKSALPTAKQRKSDLDDYTARLSFRRLNSARTTSIRWQSETSRANESRAKLA